MVRYTRHINRLLLFAAIMLTGSSCQGLITHYDRECGYNVQITYHYNQENASNENVLPQYVSNLEEYIFDSEGRLYAINPLTPDICTGQWVSEPDLPPGNYSIIAVGNRATMSEITDNGVGLKIGITRREDVLMTLANTATHTTTHTAENGHFDNCCRLYHGYRTFSVESNQTSRIRVDMVHSHHVLKFRIRWKQKAPSLGDYYVTMRYIPSEYNLMPQYVYPEQHNCQLYDCDTHDHFNRVCLDVCHHIPMVHQDRNILTYRLNLQRNVDAEIKGEFVMYRIKNETVPTMALYSGTDDSGEQQMKEINLQKYFADRKINLNEALKQEYAIEIVIDGSKVLVFPISVADWEEGGSL